MLKLLLNFASRVEEEALATDLCAAAAGPDCDTLGIIIIIVYCGVGAEDDDDGFV